MSLILFFGLSALILAVGLIFSVLVVRHHWQRSRTFKSFSDPSVPKDEELTR
ncbi:MAG: hypothetical protein ACAH59_00985 [Pseudobdellovibrionaceae bacterium]